MVLRILRAPVRCSLRVSRMRLLPPKYSGTPYWIVAAALYVLAKVLEHFDGAIYSIGKLVSGHTLKHLAAAAACFVVLRYFQTRRLIV